MSSYMVALLHFFARLVSLTLLKDKCVWLGVYQFPIYYNPFSFRCPNCHQAMHWIIINTCIMILAPDCPNVMFSLVSIDVYYSCTHCTSCSHAMCLYTCTVLGERVCLCSYTRSLFTDHLHEIQSICLFAAKVCYCENVYTLPCLNCLAIPSFTPLLWNGIRSGR